MKIEQVLEANSASEFEPQLFDLVCDLWKVTYFELLFLHL